MLCILRVHTSIGFRNGNQLVVGLKVILVGNGIGLFFVIDKDRKRLCFFIVLVSADVLTVHVVFPI